MTGKEALEKLLDMLKHWQGRNTIFDKIHGDCISKELDELTKYKRAFEILKDRLTFVVYESPNIPSTYFLLAKRKEIKEEEVELIEELMWDAGAVGR